MTFRPDRPEEKFSVLGDAKPPSNLWVVIQLVLIFSVVRVVMLTTGMIFIRIPLIDSLLIPIARALRGYLEL